MINPILNLISSNSLGYLTLEHPRPHNQKTSQGNCRPFPPDLPLDFAPGRSSHSRPSGCLNQHSFRLQARPYQHTVVCRLLLEGCGCCGFPRLRLQRLRLRLLEDTEVERDGRRHIFPLPFRLAGEGEGEGGGSSLPDSDDVFTDLASPSSSFPLTEIGES